MTRRARLVVRALFYLLVALACFATIVPSVLSARADRLRINSTEANIAKAIRLDHLNANGYAIQAELLERAGRLPDAEQSWREALQRNPRDAQAWVRKSLLAEQRADLPESERCLRQAAQVSRMWLPSWSLVNFYSRHGQNHELYAASRLAFERSTEDVSALFPILQETGATPAFILDLLPRNRRVLSAWLIFLMKPRSPQIGLEEAAVQLATLIPQTAPGWPGTDAITWPKRSYPVLEQEQTLLLSGVDRLLESENGFEAARLWNLLVERQIVSGTRWTAAAPLINNQFRFETASQGLGWRLSTVDTLLAPESGEIRIHLDGHQPESIELLKQRTYIPPASAYRLLVESQTDGLADDQSLEWQILDQAGQNLANLPVHPSEDWNRASANLASAPTGRVVEVLLICRRPLGSVRAQGTLRLRLVSLEQSH